MYAEDTFVTFINIYNRTFDFMERFFLREGGVSLCACVCLFCCCCNFSFLIKMCGRHTTTAKSKKREQIGEHTGQQELLRE